MRVRFIPFRHEAHPARLSLKGLLDDPTLAAKFTGQVVSSGVTAITEVRDRLLTPTRWAARPPDRNQRPGV